MLYNVRETCKNCDKYPAFESQPGSWFLASPKYRLVCACGEQTRWYKNAKDAVKEWEKYHHKEGDVQLLRVLK